MTSCEALCKFLLLPLDANLGRYNDIPAPEADWHDSFKTANWASSEKRAAATKRLLLLLFSKNGVISECMGLERVPSRH